MTPSGLIASTPLWLLYIVTLAIVLLSAEAGWRMGAYVRPQVTSKKDMPVGAVVGAILSLLAFMLAFTFNMGANRYDVRRALVVAEANAIGTTYLRTALLPEPHRSQAQDALRQYTGLRLRGIDTITSQDVMAQIAVLQDKLWAGAAAAGAANPDAVTTGLYIQSLNEMIDLDATRVAAGRNRIPDSIWFVLYCVTILSMVALGFQFGLGGPLSRTAIILLGMVFTAVILLIADLDRPQGGIVQIGQQAMLDLMDKISSPTQ